MCEREYSGNRGQVIYRTVTGWGAQAQPTWKGGGIRCQYCSKSLGHNVAGFEVTEVRLCNYFLKKMKLNKICANCIIRSWQCLVFSLSVCLAESDWPSEHLEFSWLAAWQLGLMQRKISIFLNNPRPPLNKNNQVLCGSLAWTSELLAHRGWVLHLSASLSQSVTFSPVQSNSTPPRNTSVRWYLDKDWREKRLKSWGWCSQMF